MTPKEAFLLLQQEQKNNFSQAHQKLEQSLLLSNEHASIKMGMELLMQLAPQALIGFFTMDSKQQLVLTDRFDTKHYIDSVLNASFNEESEAWNTLWEANAFDDLLWKYDDLLPSQLSPKLQKYLLKSMCKTIQKPIKGEVFTMGAFEGDTLAWDEEKEAKPLPMPFNIEVAVFPVTQLQWYMVMGTEPSRNQGFWRPVENISWFQAIEFCNRLSQQQNLEPVYLLPSQEQVEADPVGACRCTKQNLKANGWRLPLEIEWEYAAKANTQHVFSGSCNVDDVAWYGSREWKNNRWQYVGGGNCGDTQSVGRKAPNAFGLYDMSGNVWEWCWNVFGDLPQSPSQLESYNNQYRGCEIIKKGGAWRYVPKSCRISNRGYQPPNSSYVMGMRLFRTYEE